MMAGDQFASFTCSFVAEDGKESGSSGIIVQIDREDLEQLLEEPSCLKKKVGDKLSAGGPCYAMITAHSSVYAPDAPDEPAVQRLAGRKIVVGNSDNQFKMPIEECVQCRAVSCCGKDSIMRLTEEDTNFTLMPHARGGECHIGFDFLILFLNADAVNKRKPTGFPDPPTLSLAQCPQFPTTSPLKTIMYWHSGGRVEKANITMKPESKPQIHKLCNEVESFMAKRSVPYQHKSQISQIGAPVVICTKGGSHLIGINTGKEVTTLHGIFELLKGGLIPFLAVMRHPNARSLKPSKWKEHVLPHVKSQEKFTPHYVTDLLHHLLERKNGVKILKITGGGNPEDIISALEILTAVFDNLKDGSGEHFDDSHSHSNGKECKCIHELYSSTLNEHLVQFAEDKTVEHATNMVEALFKCFVSMLNCESIAREVLNENIEPLRKIATSQRYRSNHIIVNECFMIIILKRHDYLAEELENRKCEPTAAMPIPSRRENRSEFEKLEGRSYTMLEHERHMTVSGRAAMVHGRYQFEHNLRIRSHSESSLATTADSSHTPYTSHSGVYTQSQKELQEEPEQPQEKHGQPQKEHGRK